ncbi:hypothetical protein D018_3213B, partial [Vibrio parahaemolyticus VP2007-007]
SLNHCAVNTKAESN